MRTPFENWWCSRPSYRDSDKAASEEAWNAAIEFQKEQQRKADQELINILVPDPIKGTR
jgi:hypothetical protein